MTLQNNSQERNNAIHCSANFGDFPEYDDRLKIFFAAVQNSLSFSF